MPILRRRGRTPDPEPAWILPAIGSIDASATAVLVSSPDNDSPPLIELAPSAERPWFTVATAATPGLMAENDAVRQLVIALPPGWDEVRRNAWSEWLLSAIFDYGRTALLREGDTLGNGEPPEPYTPEAPFVGALLWEPLITPPVVSHGGRTLELLAVIPLHRAELDTARRDGSDALLDGLDEGEVSELLLLDRPSVV
jgi:hypothetical protein